MTPVFLLSLPRSGSTLLQRILGAHPEVATCPEPWWLLPHLYAFRERGVYAEYSHREYRKAVTDFAGRLPDGEDDLRAACRTAATEIYRKAAGEEVRYFLDKTPRYALVADELAKTFPEARFIFLWRNPLAVTSSMMRTWNEGRWNLHWYRMDLERGLRLLVDTGRQVENGFTLRYEDLVADPHGAVEHLCDFLEIERTGAMLESFTEVEATGRMGDPSGTEQYESVSDATLEKWRASWNNPLRKRWMRRYLARIGSERLEAMGYPMDELLRALESVPTSYEHLLSDLVQLPKAWLHPWAEPEMARHKIEQLRRREQGLSHS